MKFRLYSSILLVLFIALIAALSSLDSDLETLSKAGIANKKPAIVVNQVGYFTQGQKSAFFRRNTKFSAKNNQLNNPAQLINYDNRELIATLSLGQETIDADTQDAISTIDFTDQTEPGTYYLKLGRFKSAPFEIGTDIYEQPLITLLRSYYLQRCGVEINDPITGISHAPCHLEDGVIPNEDEYHSAGEIVPALGGWHDTGGYSKYVATTTVTTARLLNLYEQYPHLFPDSQLNIPESGNGVSDLLDEMEFGLNWLLKMQRADGAIYRKLAGKTWPIDLSPEEDIQTRYLFGISTAETAKFAAAMAIASRNFQSIDAKLAARYLTAAKSAWQYLETQATMKVDWVEGYDSGSDKYLLSEFNQEESLKTDIDDRLWAAAELFITTGQDNFANYFADNVDQMDYTLFEWKDPSSLGLVNYLRQNRQPISEELREKIKLKIQQRADLILNKVNQNAYHIANDRFIWGSNKMTAEEGITLVYAYQLTQNIAYLHGAIDQLDYLLGRNHFNQTFITDIGKNPVKNLSNIYAIAKKISIPGLVVGGPNSDGQDGMVFRNKGQLSYIDNPRSYTTNENAIDYNASVISLITNLIVAQDN